MWWGFLGVVVVKGVWVVSGVLFWGCWCVGENGDPRGRDSACRRLTCVWCSGIEIGGIVTMSVLRHCMFHRSGGVPIMSHCKRAWCRLSICWRVMLFAGMRSGRVFPRVRCSVVSIAMVPHDHGSRGESFCIAIR